MRTIVRYEGEDLSIICTKYGHQIRNEHEKLLTFISIADIFIKGSSEVLFLAFFFVKCIFVGGMIFK